MSEDEYGSVCLICGEKTGEVVVPLGIIEIGQGEPTQTFIAIIHPECVDTYEHRLAAEGSLAGLIGVQDEMTKMIEDTDV